MEKILNETQNVTSAYVLHDQAQRRKAIGLRFGTRLISRVPTCSSSCCTAAFVSVQMRRRSGCFKLNDRTLGGIRGICLCMRPHIFVTRYGIDDRKNDLQTYEQPILLKPQRSSHIRYTLEQ